MKIRHRNRIRRPTLLAFRSTPRAGVVIISFAGSNGKKFSQAARWPSEAIVIRGVPNDEEVEITFRGNTGPAL